VAAIFPTIRGSEHITLARAQTEQSDMDDARDRRRRLTKSVDVVPVTTHSR